jgi:hypothetical protein
MEPRRKSEVDKKTWTMLSGSSRVLVGGGCLARWTRTRFAFARNGARQEIAVVARTLHWFSVHVPS